MTYELSITLAFVLIFSTIVVVWISTALASHRLLRALKESKPQELYARFPEAFDAGRNPKKFWFFLTPEGKRITSGDPCLAKLQRRFERQLMTSIAAPLLCIVVLAVLMLVL